MRLSMQALIVLAMLFVADVAQAIEAGHVARLIGTVEVERLGATVPLAVGGPILVGDRIRTGSNGQVEIALQGGARVFLASDSELLVPQQASGKVAAVDLLRGTARASLLEDNEGGSFTLRGRTASASGRSTEWVVETGDAGTAVFSIGGDVQVIGTGGGTTLDPGFGTDVPAGARPAEPVEWAFDRRNVTLARTLMP